MYFTSLGGMFDFSWGFELTSAFEQMARIEYLASTRGAEEYRIHHHTLKCMQKVQICLTL